jgi:DNA adenine methylase
MTLPRPTKLAADRPRRPVLRYHGGKFRLAWWLVQFFPRHRVYVEPFGGAASVLLQKEPSYAEIYNDLEDEVVNLFRVLREPAQAERLRQLVALTPFARAEFEATYSETPATEPVERARQMIIRSFMGFGSASMTRGYRTGFRFNANRSGTTPARDWQHWPTTIPLFTERLRGIVIEHRDAVDVIRQFDKPTTLFYVDPPYVHATRSSMRASKHSGTLRRAYRHEMADADHRRLAEALNSIQGMAVVSGYPHPLYDDELYRGWARHETEHLADGAKVRTEAVWLNAACARALEEEREQLHLIREERP